ncbi:MAG: hypothetical protein CMO80_10895 [Verrucomicrobiales bacterium]|nr:hypothetical protein [Verrucomicrobiales bacterium]|tara:strand:- start:9031 stop:11928 length:2898 start_codon:yes stop_codon:yes gene_type:complete
MPLARNLLLYLLATLIAPTVIAVDFERDVAPIFITRCLECHQGSEPSGGLLLTSEAGLSKGGKSGDAIREKLLERVRAGEMPPEKQGRSQRLPAKEIAVLERWIEAGANWPDQRTLDWFERTTRYRAGRDWWSLQPIKRPEAPSVKISGNAVHPIDAFVMNKLQQAGMKPAPRANKRVLLRRLHYSLTGLSPTREQLDQFVADDSPKAWENAIEELLASPHYGERWARYWLDIARFAETSGYERDQEKPYAWRYRDWVVKAFNDDMPFRRFILEQLAGDEIDARSEQSVVATGFLRLGAWNDEPNIPADYEYDRLEDIVHTTSSAFLGLTVKCARCHNHKFDPILQEDYYRMGSAFWPGPIAARSGGLLGGPTTNELGYDKVLGWTDISAKPRPLHLLKNGERLHPRKQVAPASLSSIPSLERRFDPPPDGAKTTGRRLQLAKWIADPDNPLTARVLVNRIWQHHFGRAIVRTPNNFGFLADPPTHPDLLDWLAAEFLSSGGSIKHLHRLILRSETWRQSSLHPQREEYSVRDSGNRLWWRAERRRLDAEALRDSMLQATAELDLTLGGPSFKPTISPEALEGLSRKSSAWKASPVEKQNRRSLYIYMKRGLLPPMMTTFDLCDTTLSCGERDVTTVPTQALALLNNAFVHRRSEYLAGKLTDDFATAEERIEQAWTSILKREPKRDELLLAHRHLNVQRDAFDRQAGVDALAPKMSMHLRADQAKTRRNEGQVESITDISGNGRHAFQKREDRQPVLNPNGFGGRPTIEFSKRDYLDVNGSPMKGQYATIICVANDHGPPGHREIISNWRRGENVGSSVFLGLTAENTVRFCDVFNKAGTIPNRDRPFILTAVNGEHLAAVYHNGRLLKSQSNPLRTRKLDTPWVIGQQGNINGEFWQGGIAEIRVYDGALDRHERRTVERELAERYEIELPDAHSGKKRSSEFLALASLCHVLLNSNEFIFID